MTQEQTFFSAVRPWRVPVGVGFVCLLLAGCGANQLASTIDPKYGVSASPRVVADGQPIPKGGGAYRVGKPYKVAGRTYVPAEDPNYAAEGIASWYGDGFHGRLTANGEVFDRWSISAAHPTLPMPSYVRVTNLRNNRSIIVRINDRGPYHEKRVIDVSHATADLLGFKANGVAKVRVEYVGRAPLEGSDDRKLVATLRDDGPAQIPSNSAVMVASAEPFVPRLPSILPTTRSTALEEVPVPLQRPYDLGHGEGEQVAANEPAVGQAANTEIPQVREVASAPLAAPVAQRVAGASAQPAFQPEAQPAPRATVVASGWQTGAAPVSGLGYAGVPVYGTTR